MSSYLCLKISRRSQGGGNELLLFATRRKECLRNLISDKPFILFQPQNKTTTLDNL